MNPYYSYDKKCISSCPLGYYANSTDNTCYACDNSCTSCSWITKCLDCVKSKYLYNGQCISLCPT